MKKIRSAADLAINGAPPAFDEPLHVGRPNIGDLGKFNELTAQMFERRWLTNNGPLVQDFERQIAGLHNAKHCVAMCNGTIALEIAIRALRLSGEVIIPSYTFIATAHALSWQSIKPVFADIDPETHNLDPDAVRRMITPRTTGIIGVHLWGRPAPVAALQEIADEHRLTLMFDAAHAFGCSIRGKRIGAFGRCEVLSFHATKVFNSFEGGAVLTNDDELAEAMRLMRNFGFAGFDNVIHPGTNGKMPEINAAMGLVNLQSLQGFIKENKARYDEYTSLLSGIEGIRLINYTPNDEPNYQYAVIEVGAGEVARDQIVAALHAEGVLARKYFWPGCHRMKPYRESCSVEEMQLPNTDAVAKRVIVLPTGLSLTFLQLQAIAACIRLVIRSEARSGEIE